MNQPDSPVALRSLRIRPMLMSDLHRVAEIETLSSPAPWNDAIFRGCLRPDYQCAVGETRKGVFGFSISNYAAEEGHLLNIAIHPHFRCSGLGAILLRDVIAKLKEQCVLMVFLEVRESNTAAIRLYMSHGFSQIGCRKNYYERGNVRENALTMALELAD